MTETILLNSNDYQYLINILDIYILSSIDATNRVNSKHEFGL